MNLWSLLEGKEDATALYFRGESYSYQKLRHLIVRRVKIWQTHNIRPRQRIGIIADNPFEAIIALFTCAKLNLVFTIIPFEDQFPTQKEIILQDLQPHFITDQNRLISKYIDSPLCSKDVSVIFYTSGSTTQPKGVQHSAKNVLICAREMSEALQLSDNDRALLILPLSFHYGFSILSSILQAGGTLCISEAIFPNQIVQEIKMYQCSVLGTVPHFWMLIAKSLPQSVPQEFPLRTIISAGDSSPNTLLSLLSSKLPRTEIHLFYGCTETLRACHYHWKQGSKDYILGKSLPAAKLTQTKKGTLQQRGQTLMLGYWNADNPLPSYPTEFDLGDIVTQDSAGDWIFISRSVDIIKSRGYRISPTILEERLMKSPNIVEAIVFQKNDTIEAIIALKNMIEMSSFIKDIPHWLRPQKIHYFHQQIPRSSRGKISRQWLIHHVIYPRTIIENNHTSSPQKSRDI